MAVYLLMREVHETPDRVSADIASVIGDGERVRSGTPHRNRVRNHFVFPDPTFFMEFWNMKQRGELTADEMPAVWATLMRAIDASTVVRIVLGQCINTGTPNQGGSLAQLWAYRDEALGALSSKLRPPFVRKVRTKLCELLREAASMNGVVVLDPVDAHMLLSACETALVLEAEEKRKWVATR